MQSSFTKQPQGPLRNSSSTGQDYKAPGSVGGLSLITPAGFSFISPTIQVAQNGLARLKQNDILVNRVLAHTTMITVVILVVALSQLDLSWGAIKAIRPSQQNLAELPQANATEEENLPLTLATQLSVIQNDILTRAAVPRTTIPDRSLVEQNSSEIRTYTVEGGDTISGIAAKFGLAPETIIWSNPELEDNPDLLSVGQQVLILPVDGVYHQVGGSDTIEGIAGTFKTSPAAIISHPLNNLDPDNPVIQAGEWLVVPGGSKPFVPRTVTAYSGPAPANASTGSGIFGWPASGSISNGYFSYHPGIDIAAWTGAPVLAADSGYVVVAGWDNLYGYHVVIDHGNGFQTLYAHMESYYVGAGENVAKGEQIGEMGSTGNSTGPHLHFELRHGTVQRNPYGFLP